MQHLKRNVSSRLVHTCQAGPSFILFIYLSAPSCVSSSLSLGSAFQCRLASGWPGLGAEQSRAAAPGQGGEAGPGGARPGPAGAWAPSAAPGLREALPGRGAFAARLGLEGTPQAQAGPGDLSRGPPELAEAPHASREPSMAAAPSLRPRAGRGQNWSPGV